MKNDEADWNFIWQNMSEGMAKNPTRSYRFNQITKFMPKEIGLSVLDFGCGTGELLAKLEKEFPANHYFAADISSEAIDKTSVRIPNAETSLIKLTSDGPQMEFSNNLFDLIVISEVLEHISDEKKTLAMLHSILKPTGRIICTVPAGPMSKFDKFIGHHRHYTSKRLHDIFRETNFNNILVNRAGFPGISVVRIATIISGNLFIRSIQKENFAKSTVSKCSLVLLKILFQFSLSNSPLGWQLVLVAHKNQSKINRK
jgi:ubiquinone/menaquinone biosynthesis C-methylase UbiE